MGRCPVYLPIHEWLIFLVFMDRFIFPTSSHGSVIRNHRGIFMDPWAPAIVALTDGIRKVKSQRIFWKVPHRTNLIFGKTLGIGIPLHKPYPYSFYRLRIPPLDGTTEMFGDFSESQPSNHYGNSRSQPSDWGLRFYHGNHVPEKSWFFGDS